MENIKKKIDELTKMVAERGGSCIIYVDPYGKGEGMQVVSEGCKKNLAMMVGAAMLADDGVKDYITRGVEAAMFVMKRREEEKKNDKADC